MVKIESDETLSYDTLSTSYTYLLGNRFSKTRKCYSPLGQG